MPQPTLQDVHVNRPLTNISVAYLQEAAGVEFVADKAFPAVPVENKSDLYYTYARADFNREKMQKRALSTESAGTGYNLNSTGTYNCDVWSLHKDVDDQIRSNSDSPLAPDRDATIFLTQKALIRRETNGSRSSSAPASGPTTLPAKRPRTPRTSSIGTPGTTPMATPSRIFATRRPRCGCRVAASRPTSSW